MADLSLLGFAAVLSEMTVRMQDQHEAMEKAAIIVETEAKRVIGTYDYGWPQLAASTQADRVAKGFSPNDPLLRTGEMRASIQHNSAPTEAHIGSNEDKAVWQELGTSRIPPRSFLVKAAIQKEKEVVDVIGRTVYTGLIKA